MKYMNHVKSGLLAMALHVQEYASPVVKMMLSSTPATVTSWILWMACMAM